jgi:hypothetical protein
MRMAGKEAFVIAGASSARDAGKEDAGKEDAARSLHP